MDSDEILTSEGVFLQVQPASVLARAGSWLIDAVTTAVLFLGLLFLLAFLSGNNQDFAAVQAWILTILAVCVLVIPTTVETLTRGRSLGKLVFGLRIVRDDGGPAQFRHAAMRTLVGFFELWMLLGSLAFIVGMLNDKGKRAGDFLAGTYCANMRGVKSIPLPLYLPPELASWVSYTDIRPIPDALAMQARQFLLRLNGFSPMVRQHLGLRLAAQLESHVAPSPPPGTHPERFIAAVLYERRLREDQSYQASLPRLNAQLADLNVLPGHVRDPEW
ncbi:MAG: RDD family protein [Propionibacteriaceae bacterium]|jgi:uncharacterized RDD family membrane protein YckC|nr:RDD family protein [Propionibacteriaceae bacterium]